MQILEAVCFVAGFVPYNWKKVHLLLLLLLLVCFWKSEWAATDNFGLHLTSVLQESEVDWSVTLAVDGVNWQELVLNPNAKT